MRRTPLFVAGLGLVAATVLALPSPSSAGPATVGATAGCEAGTVTITWHLQNDDAAGSWTGITGSLSGGAAGAVAWGQTTLAPGQSTTATTQVAGTLTDTITLHVAFTDAAGPASNDIVVQLSGDCPDQGSQFLIGLAQCANNGSGNAVAGTWRVTWTAYNLTGGSVDILGSSATNNLPDPPAWSSLQVGADSTVTADGDVGAIAAVTSVSASVDFSNEATDSSTIRITPGACVPPAVRGTTTTTSTSTSTSTTTSSSTTTTTAAGGNGNGGNQNAGGGNATPAFTG